MCLLTSSGGSELEYTYYIPPYELLYAHRMYEYCGRHVSIPTRALGEAAFHQISVSRIVVLSRYWFMDYLRYLI